MMFVNSRRQLWSREQHLWLGHDVVCGLEDEHLTQNLAEGLRWGRSSCGWTPGPPSPRWWSRWSSRLRLVVIRIWLLRWIWSDAGHYHMWVIVILGWPWPYGFEYYEVNNWSLVMVASGYVDDNHSLALLLWTKIFVIVMSPNGKEESRGPW